ncbi:MAG: hypothetical protein WC637_12320, partial [Victivallales bacterium]
MNLKQSDYERLGKIYGLEQEIGELDAKFATVRADHKRAKKEITDRITAIKKEIESPVETPELPMLTAKEQSKKTVYEEREEKLGIAGRSPEDIANDERYGSEKTGITATQVKNRQDDYLSSSGVFTKKP